MNTETNRGDMTELQRVMERVRKLLAIAQDERANPEEAATAASMADKVMRKYQIEYADIVVQTMRSKDNFGSDDVRVLMKRHMDHKRPKKVPCWAGWLSVAIAQLHDCQARVAYTDEMGACIRFAGYKPDVQVACWTFDYLANAMISSTRRWQKVDVRTLAESESYRRGFILALCSSLRKEAEAKKREMEVASSSRALVVVKAQAVAEYFGEVKYGTHKGRTNFGDAFSEGRQAGEKVNVNARAVGHTSGAAPASHRLQ